MEVRQKLIGEENLNLRRNYKLITNEVEKNKQLIEKYSYKDINTYKVVDEIQFKNAIDNNRKLQEIEKDPYYGRLDIKYDEENSDINIYIGKRDFFVEDKMYIVSWAAPIADVFNRYEIGKYNYEYVDNQGRKIKFNGDIKEKRKIRIVDGKIENVVSYKYGNAKEEELFIENKIKKSNTSRLGSIVESIQENQNEIIRKPLNTTVLVQGCAGSGKSSVAYHRLSYLIYNYKLNKEDVLVISPNKLFKNYTENLFWELGADFPINQVTFDEVAKFVLNTDYKYFNKVPSMEKKEGNKIKTGRAYKKLLDKYIEYLKKSYIPKNNIKVENYDFVNYDEINFIWLNNFGDYKINDRIDKLKIYVNKLLKEKQENIILNIKEEYEVKEKEIKNLELNGIKYTQIKKVLSEERDIKIIRVNETCNGVRSKYISSLKKINLMECYNKLINDSTLIKKLARGIMNEDEVEFIINNEVKGKFNKMDLIPVAYLSIKLKEIEGKYEHVIVDECQDLSYLEVAVIEDITKTATLVGDFNQRVTVVKDSVTFKEVKEIFKEHEYFITYNLNKSFRNSRSITEYSNAILGPYFPNKRNIPAAFNRVEDKPLIIMSGSVEKTIEAIIENIDIELKESRNIGIILKSEKSAKTFYTKLKKKDLNYKINLIENESAKYQDGINIISAKLSKGLEFNTVIIPDANKYMDNEEDRRLLYVATTRALNKLEIYSKEEKEFIHSIDNNLWNIKRKVLQSSILDGLKDTIVKALKANSDNIPTKLISRINEIDNAERLLFLIQQMNKCDNIDEFLNEERLLPIAK